MLGDYRAACLRLIEGHSETGQVEAEPALDYGAVVGRVDDGAFHRQTKLVVVLNGRNKTT